MKIKNNEKGINYKTHDISDEEYYDYLAGQEEPPVDETDYVLEMIQKNEQAQREWEKQGNTNIKHLIAKQKPLAEKFNRQRARGETTYKGKSYIGDRIEFLRKKNKQEIAEISRSIGVSRSSLHRYIKGSHCPSEKTLRKIISGLFISVSDFCYEPDDFEKWKSAFEKTESNDIFAFKEKILKQLRINNFTYQNNGATMRLPNRYFELFRNLVKNSFDVIELLPHDKQ